MRLLKALFVWDVKELFFTVLAIHYAVLVVNVFDLRATQADLVERADRVDYEAQEALIDAELAQMLMDPVNRDDDADLIVVPSLGDDLSHGHWVRTVVEAAIRPLVQ